MVLIDNGMFELQARTARSIGRGLATVFVAAAAKEENAARVEGRINTEGNTVLSKIVYNRLQCVSTLDKLLTSNGQ